MIAVTGANGLLGSFIVRKLHETQTPFVALKRNTSDTSLLADLNPYITWRDADVLDPISLLEALEGVKGVIHAAALVSFNPRDSKKLYAINVEGTKNVVDACLVNGVERLLHVSSVAALGRQKNQPIVTEKNQWIESSLNTHYGETKYKAELEVFRGQEEGLNTIIVNPSVILAQGNWLKSSARLFNYAWKERPFYTGGSFNYVDVRDVTTLILSLYYSSHSGERFILNGGTVPIKKFFDTTAALFNKKGPGIKVPKSILTLVAGLESVRSFIFGTEPLITRETARLADTHFIFDNQKVINAMEYPFRPMEDTLLWCAEFYRKQMELKNGI
jgi:dihydroflavonol-4-reductase